jgi:hypothetical protein
MTLQSSILKLSGLQAIYLLMQLWLDFFMQSEEEAL